MTNIIKTAQRLLQGNINHAARAQDLLLHTILEWNIDLAIVTEPYYIQPKPYWLGDSTGKVTIIGKASSGALPLTLLGRGDGYVSARWGEVAIVGGYFSPNKDLAQFNRYLEALATEIRRLLPGPLLFMGDLNAKSREWGSPTTDARGRALEEILAELDLLVLNRGSIHTCIRHNGGSIIDVSFASPVAARRVNHWRVMVGTETLSDHRYVRMDIADPSLGRMPSERVTKEEHPPFPRWAIKKMNRDAVIVASVAKSWEEQPIISGHVEEEAEWFRHTWTQISDVAMPRVRAPPSKKAAYWWHEELTNLRQQCRRARKQYTRCRRRRHHTNEEAAQYYTAYKETKRIFQIAIRTAKMKALQEFMATLDEDPFGRPYLLVRNKLQTGGAPLTETMSTTVLHDVVAALFPTVHSELEHERKTKEEEVTDWNKELEITVLEMETIIQRMRSKRTAPGPDGVTGRLIVQTMGILGDRLQNLYTACLRESCFPQRWKTARLVLLQKEGRPANSPSAYRPICLLDEAGKMLERIIASRLKTHLSTIGPDLADSQFGFRTGRSTVDAILRVRSLIQPTVEGGGVAVAVSLDIANAFNSLPWQCIRDALKYHKVPCYLRRIIADYLKDRRILYRGRYGVIYSKNMSCGVPQGSVLGPLLWNIGYNWVLRGALLPGLTLVCYADDTLIVAGGESWPQTLQLATVGVALVVGRIRTLGLRVALSKTEAIYFPGPRTGHPPKRHMSVEGIDIPILPNLKYLGLVLDSKWTFGDHFSRMAPRVRAAIHGLGRLMPNIGGPREKVRRLYMGVVGSMVLYGAPVWAHTVQDSRILRNVIAELQRRLSIRLIRGYRTISSEAAAVLAGSIPWHLLAEAYAVIYARQRSLQKRGVVITPRIKTLLRLEAREAAIDKWQRLLMYARTGLRSVEAIRPVLRPWLERAHGSLTFGLVQVLTGHGCFGEYLHERAGRETTSRCHHCGEPKDTAQHTLEECPAWHQQREELMEQIGVDLTLPEIIPKMLESSEHWTAVVSFCDAIMHQKEAAERERERDPAADPIRAGRGKGKRRRDHLLP